MAATQACFQYVFLCVAVRSSSLGLEWSSYVSQTLEQRRQGSGMLNLLVSLSQSKDKMSLTFSRWFKIE